MTPSELLAIAEECGKYWQCEGMCGKDQHGVEANVVIALLRVMEAVGCQEHHDHSTAIEQRACAPSVRDALAAAEKEMGNG